MRKFQDYFMSTNQENQKKENMADARIDATYYDSSTYFEKRSKIFFDLNNTFQRYRVSEVLKIYHPKSGERVLDLGCGWGTFSFILAPQVKEVVGLDFSQRSVDICKEQAQKRGLTNVSFVQADATKTGLPADSFDSIIAADLFEHLYPEDSNLVIAECFRILKPGGIMSIWTPHRGHIFEILKNRNIILEKDISHVDYKSMRRMKDYLKQNGFTVNRAYYAPTHLPVFSIIERIFLPIIPIFRRRVAIQAEKPRSK